MVPILLVGKKQSKTTSNVFVFDLTTLNTQSKQNFVLIKQVLIAAG